MKYRPVSIDRVAYERVISNSINLLFYSRHEIVFALLGHELGRPLYGAKYCSASSSSSTSSQQEQDVLLSWGVDGRLVLWDSCSEGQVRAPLAILKNYNDDDDDDDITRGNHSGNSYPIYAVDVNAKNVAVGGGGTDGGILGIPVYLYDLWNVPSEPQPLQQQQQQQHTDENTDYDVKVE